MSAGRQTRLLGEMASDSVHIQTHGRVIRPALALLTSLVNECKLQLHDDFCRVTAVDPANVGMVDLWIHADAFERYDGPEEQLTVGLDVAGLASALRQARKGKTSSDPVSLDIDTGRTVVEIRREYDGATVTYADEVLSQDPDSIRKEPDLPNLDLPASATVPVDALSDGVSYIAAGTDHVLMARDGDDFRLAADGDEDSPADFSAAVSVADAVSCADDEAPTSWYGLGYVTDMVSALDTALVDEARVLWGDQFPCKFLFERHGEDTVLYDGQYMLAPRVKDSDSP